VDGSSATVDYGAVGKPTLLYVLSPKCVWCKRNRANIKTLIEQASGRFRVVCVSLIGDGLEKYVAENGLTGSGVEVVFDVPQPLQEKYGLGPTPEIIVLSPQSRVLAKWSGALEAKSMSEAEQFFGVKLPGLLAD